MLKQFNKLLKYLFTLRYVNLISYNRAKWLKNKLGETIFTINFKGKEYIIDNKSPKVKNVYYHGFKLSFGAINKGFLLLLAGLTLNILPQLLVVTLSFACIRVFVGGLHFNSYTKCAWISLIILVILSLLSKYIPYNDIVNVGIFSTVFYIAIRYAPVEHKNRLLTDKEKVKFKHISLILTFVLFIIQMIFKNDNINNSIMYGVLLAGIIALPIFKKVE